MTQTASNVHPRKLYTTLCSCGDPRSRADAALEFLCGNVQGVSGFLWLARAGDLSVAANSTRQEMPAGLMEHALAFWARESEVESAESRTRTIEVGQLLDANVTESPTWKLANGDCFEPRLLALYRESRWIPVGIAALKVTPGQSLSPIRRAHIDSLCNAFLDSGDVGGGQRAPGLDP